MNGADAKPLPLVAGDVKPVTGRRKDSAEIQARQVFIPPGQKWTRRDGSIARMGRTVDAPNRRMRRAMAAVDRAKPKILRRFVAFQVVKFAKALVRFAQANGHDFKTTYNAAAYVPHTPKVEPSNG